MMKSLPENVQVALGASVPFPQRLGDPREYADLALHMMENAYMNGERSEEHTSELQSLMRISYAVFCLKKKKIITHHIEPRDHYRSTHSQKYSTQHDTKNTGEQ